MPTLAVGMYVELDEEGRQNGDCSDNLMFRPNGATYTDPTLLSPGWCTLSVLFSDWDRSGRRDLRIANDKHYYRDGEEQLWRIDEGEPPRLYTREDGWNKIQIWGMGIASHDVTGDGLPEVFLTSQGDNKFQRTHRRAGSAELRRHRDSARGYGAPAVRRRRRDAVHRLASRVPGRQQRWIHGPVHLQGQCRFDARVCGCGSQQPPSRPAGRNVRGRRRSMRASFTTTAAAARRSSTSISTDCSTSSR